MTIQGLITVLHVVSFVIGAGAAASSDYMFFRAIKDRKLSDGELDTLRALGKLVWIGIGLITATGIALFLLDPARLIASPKFLAKMTVVFVIIGNGLAFHGIHLPRLIAARGTDLKEPNALRGGAWLFASGGISGASWFSAIFLGSIDIPAAYASYLLLMSAYAALVACSICAGLVVRKIVL
jgi:hypothetical protein